MHWPTLGTVVLTLSSVVLVRSTRGRLVLVVGYALLALGLLVTEDDPIARVLLGLVLLGTGVMGGRELERARSRTGGTTASEGADASSTPTPQGPGADGAQNSTVA